MKRRTTEYLFELTKTKILELHNAYTLGGQPDAYTTDALIELHAEFLAAAKRQDEQMRFNLCDVAIVSLRAAFALRVLCGRLGYKDVPPDLAELYWKIMKPVLAPPDVN